MLILFNKTIFEDEKQFTNSGVSIGTVSKDRLSNEDSISYQE